MPDLRLNWGTMSYHDAGSPAAPAIVFLHGTGCDHTDWDGVLQALGGACRTITVDFRAHGRSDATDQPFTLSDLADDVVALTEHLKLDRYLIAGHSLGGMVSMLVAERSPRVAGLALFEGWTKLAAMAAFESGRYYGRLGPEVIATIQRKMDELRGRLGLHVWNPLWGSAERFDATHFLASASIPILECYGALGRRPDAEERLRVPASPFISWRWIEGSGHYLPLEKPREVAEACGELLRRVAVIHVER
jgi:pimeloyl-ACP methyl ester carboxylesterase